MVRGEVRIEERQEKEKEKGNGKHP